MVKPRVASSEGEPAAREELCAVPAPTRHFLSVGTKLTIVMLVVLGIVTSITYFQVSRNEREQLLSAKERSAKMVTELFAAGVTAPLSFNDDPGVREHVALLTASSNVRYAAVWDVSESNHAERGTKVDEVIKEGSEAAASQKRELPKAIEVERTDDLLTVEQPVTSAAGETLGVVRVSFSLDRELAAIAKAKQRTLITSIVMAIALAGVLLALTRTLIVKRLAVLSLAAKRFEEQGSSEELRSADDLAKCSLCSYVAFAVPTVKNTNDEVGALAHALSSMAETIATREARIFERNQDLRHILDNVAEGLMTVKKDGTMSHERSRILDDWFGAPADPRKFFEYFEAFAPETARWLRIGWTALQDDCMPVEVIFDQMPRRFEHRGRFYELGYLPIWEGPEADQVLDEVLVVVSDVTSTEKRERAEQAQREAMNIFRRILDDRAGFREFFRRTSELVDSIDPHCDPNNATSLMRDIHTLKGNTALYGIEGLAEVCHQIESRIHEEGGGVPTVDEVQQIRSAWDAVRRLSNELQLSFEDRIELSAEEYSEHIRSLESFASHRELLASAREWSHEPATQRLQRIAEQARSLARRLGKGETRVAVSALPAALRLPPARWAGFWSVFTHVLRNTLDHGIESSAERVAAGKSPHGHVEISMARTSFGVELTVTDDGRGIRWEKIRDRAAQLGLPHATPLDLEEALYADKVSTQSVASRMSGRGVGMGAVRQVVRECGGRIEVESEAGAGTTFRFQFPMAMLGQPSPPRSSSYGSGYLRSRPSPSIQPLDS